MRDLIVVTARDLAQAVGSKHICLPTVEEWREKNVGVGMDKYREERMLILIVDGTSLRCFRPGGTALAARTQYVSYKKHHAYRYFIGVLANGEIVYISKLYYGNSNDDEIFEEDGIVACLEKFYGVDPIEKALNGK